MITTSSAKVFSVLIGGARLSGASQGAGSAVVFLHAGVADSRMWAAQMAALSDAYRTVAYDRRGFGGTTTMDEPFSNVEDLHGVLDALGIATAVLVGCSQGGLVAIDFALAYPDRVAGLILIASAISGAPAPEVLLPEIAVRVDALDAAEDDGDLARVNELEAVLWLDGPTSPEGRVAGVARELFLDMNGIALAHPELLQEIKSVPAYDRLDKLTPPVLVIWGDRDFPHIRERSRMLAATIPGAQSMEIPDVAHLPSMERPEEVNHLLRDFLATR